MGFSDIFLLAALLLLLRLPFPKQLRVHALTILSVCFLFIFQPALPVREMDFWFPFFTAGGTLLVYALVTPREKLASRENLTSMLVVLGSLLLLSLSRLVLDGGLLTASRPPLLTKTLPALLLLGCLGWAISKIPETKHKPFLRAGIVLLIAALTVLKTPALSLQLSRLCRASVGQSPENALSGDLRWFGFSYIVFRLLSVLIDRGKGRKIEISAGAFLVYVCFPPTLSAGPIDRWDRFAKDFATAPRNPLPEDLRISGGQVASGLFHKFVLADALSCFALSAQNAGQFIRPGWAWVSLAAYAFQIYFDFWGLSEIAAGLGTLAGLSLPKNFDHPYLKPDLTKFWNCWHMSLTQWIRSYVFNPLTRSLRGRKTHPLPQNLIILITQLTTMLLIGLWHGVSLNFIIWGLWHGLGLFVHQLYNRHSGARLRTRSIRFQRIYTLFSTALTFLYVMLGWVWFVIPDFRTALHFLGGLFS